MSVQAYLPAEIPPCGRTPAGVFGKAGVAHTVFAKNCVGGWKPQVRLYRNSMYLNLFRTHFFFQKNRVRHPKASWRYGPVVEGAGVFVINPKTPHAVDDLYLPSFFLLEKRKKQRKPKLRLRREQ